MPVIAPRIRGLPRPVTSPLSDSASDSPMLMPAPTEAARPTKNAPWELCVSPAAANSGASVETEPSISPSSAGCTFCSTNCAPSVGASTVPESRSPAFAICSTAMRKSLSTSKFRWLIPRRRVG